MKTTAQLDVSNRIDFVYFFDVKDGNPNGDPDAGNSPRMDPETGQGLVSDVALKRKIRDFVAAAKSAEAGYDIYVKLHSALHERREPAYKELGIEDAKGGKDKVSAIEKARQWMCKNYYDVRAFGAVMSVTEFNCGQVRGPVQLTFARSLDTISDLEQCIVRKAVEKEDAEKQIQKDGHITGTFGRKSIVPYALYRCHIFFNPFFAIDTGFNAGDLDLLILALGGMFEMDRSATRGEMAARRLIAFQHSSPLGNSSASVLFDLIKVNRLDDEKAPRSFSDYEFTIDHEGVPGGVELVTLF